MLKNNGLIVCSVFRHSLMKGKQKEKQKQRKMKKMYAATKWT
jgi:hypothetical protein